MRRLAAVTGFCVAFAFAVASCGGEQRDESGGSTTATVVPTKTSPQTRGVATIRAALAQQRTARIGTAESGDPATEDVASFVDEFVDAYATGPKNAATTGIAENVLETMKNGCGPDQREK